MQDHYQLVLIDASSYLFRAFHALPSLTTSGGQPTGAIKGVISMIRKLMSDFPDSHIACVFDAKGKSFRNDLYPEYKANRTAMPDELRQQITPIHEIIRLMGVPILMEDGVEADDVIGTLASQAIGEGMNVLISTGDKDMAQLVNANVTLINTMTESVMDETGVVDKFGVKPTQIVDYLALVGDTSDNIPGVPKCGPKTAVRWLLEYESLGGVMEHADEIKGKVGENLRESLDHLPMSYQLASIRMDVPLTHTLSELTLGAPDKDALLDVFKNLEFKTWVDELSTGEDSTVEPARVQVQVLDSPELVRQWAEGCPGPAALAVAVHTAGSVYIDASLAGLSLCYESGAAAYVPLGHEGCDAATGQVLLQVLQPVLEAPGRQIVGHDLKYALNVLGERGVNFRPGFDTMLASYVLNSVASRHGLEDLALKHLGRHVRTLEDVAGKGAKQTPFDQLSVDSAAGFAAEQVAALFELHTVLRHKLDEVPSLAVVYDDIELPLTAILSRMERHGVLLDSELLTNQSGELESRLEELTSQAYDLAGETFNLGSTKQLQEIFFDKLGLPVLKKTPKGAPSTAEPVLAELALDYPLPQVIMDYRGLSKLKSTYTDQLPKQVQLSTGRVHTSYHQAVAATGRLSSTDPNLQNIPIRTEEGRRIRKAFIAPEGMVLVAADYSQIELRIMAHLSGDDGLIDAFNNRLDIHQATAAEVFGLPLEEVKDYQRRSAKAINFGLIYGMSAFGLARQLGIARNDAQAYIDLYFDRYPGVRAYMDSVRTLAAEQGYVETIFGRRLYLPEINAKNFQRRQAAERTAINAPMQGSAADIIKRAMLAVDAWLEAADVDARMIMQVHDELVLEVAEGLETEVTDELVRRMTSAADLRIPLEVDTGSGRDWDAAH
ncbi:MAG: DNA polymerase I [Proteobacteria bacterium]|nr:DNA polymerase I [Pseudomonadota bacterium]